MAMDPLTALSLARTVIQFVDFGIKILTQTVVFIRRGANEEPNAVAELEGAITYLKDICTKLKSPALSNVPSSSQSLIDT
jgi:hypothetical protein